MSDDLYDDLEADREVARGGESLGALPVVAAAKKPKSLPTTTKRPTTSLAEEVEILQQRLVTVEQENATLKRNMGTLFRTAQAELQRKDEEIARLQGELDKTKSAF